MTTVCFGNQKKCFKSDVIYINEINYILKNLDKHNIKLRFTYLDTIASNDYDFNYIINKEHILDEIYKNGYDSWYWSSLASEIKDMWRVS